MMQSWFAMLLWSGKKKNNNFSSFIRYDSAYDIGLIRLETPVTDPQAVIPLCNRKPPRGRMFGMCGIGSTTIRGRFPWVQTADDQKNHKVGFAWSVKFNFHKSFWTNTWTHQNFERGNVWIIGNIGLPGYFHRQKGSSGWVFQKDFERGPQPGKCILCPLNLSFPRISSD